MKMQKPRFTTEYGRRFELVQLLSFSRFTLDKSLVEPPR
ncbi:Uncharacterised protein [Amycolatopsis camponoti]|uniref:Uncharacterized protein n=1 Tax=Amycolatopsis camponoti TaxID=2606593 RepID=A0A6I8LQQ6_9PSEU|nr:Uncharacterised protein [Amycolatopsis camponoti]